MQRETGWRDALGLGWQSVCNDTEKILNSFGRTAPLHQNISKQKEIIDHCVWVAVETNKSL